MLKKLLFPIVLSILLLSSCTSSNDPGTETNPAETPAETVTEIALETQAETEITETEPVQPELSPVTFTESTVEGRYPNVLSMTTDAWALSLEWSENGIRFRDGSFGEMEVTPSAVFAITLRNVTTGQGNNVNTLSNWGSVTVSHSSNAVTVLLSSPSDAENVSVELTGQLDETGISWYTKVINLSETYTVMKITYPTIELQGDTIHAFLPERSGRVIEYADSVGCNLNLDYPGHLLSMPYFAYYGDNSGMYLGVHDSDGSMKSFSAQVVAGTALLIAEFPAIGAGNAENSFDVGGYMRWEAFDGDWYDATMLYADFVHNYANWLPEKGRPDTAEKFKNIAMWFYGTTDQGVVDYVTTLREAIGYPIAFHAYHWHEIGFDTEYPHFLPAKENTVSQFTAMRDADIYVIPYINAVSWGTLDTEAGYEVNYENTGKYGVALYSDGTPYIVQYTHPLAVMCPSFMTWRNIMKDLVREIEATLPVDGIYFDQNAAVAPIPCSNPEHGHVTGGGSYWSEGWNDMIFDIRTDRPEESFYFSESTGETYVKSFEGLLSWMWKLDDMVPAFPAIYAGYVQMIGRGSTETGTPFLYHFGEALLYGQQPGWINYNIDAHLPFVKQVTDTRMAYIDLFNYGKLMRPPMVETELEPVDNYRLVLSGAWKDEESGKVVVFMINISDEPTTASVTIYPEEYGVDCDAVMEVELEPLSVKAIELN